MLGFHRRTRSLIPVKDLAKYDKVPQIEITQVGDEELDMDVLPAGNGKENMRQLTLVYIMLLAEA